MWEPFSKLACKTRVSVFHATPVSRVQGFPLSSTDMLISTLVFRPSATKSGEPCVVVVLQDSPNPYLTLGGGSV